jgi:hypothetical protein
LNLVLSQLKSVVLSLNINIAAVLRCITRAFYSEAGTTDSFYAAT